MHTAGENGDRWVTECSIHAAIQPCLSPGLDELGEEEAPAKVTVSSSPLHPHSSAVVVKSLSHVRLFCDPMDCSPPGSSIHGISQARTLEWVVISLSCQLSVVLSKQAPWGQDNNADDTRDGSQGHCPQGTVASTLHGRRWVHLEMLGEAELKTRYRNIPQKFQSLLFPSEVACSGAPMTSCFHLNLLLQTTRPQTLVNSR